MERNAVNAKAIAKKIVEEKFSGAQAAFCAGSIVRGEGTATSDIDLVVVFRELKQAWRESFLYEGWPVEAFVHDPSTLNYFFHEIDGKSGVPSLPQMVVEGLLICGSEEQASNLREIAKNLIDAGPAPLTTDDIRNRIYGITDLLDDLRAPKSRAEAVGISVRLYDDLGDFILRSERRWSGNGKQISRALQRQLHEKHAKFVEAFEALFANNNAAPVIQLTEEILRAHGGPLFDGYRREAPEDWRIPLETNNSQIRTATPRDIDALFAVEGDPDEARRNYLVKRVKERSVLLVDKGKKPVGYVVFDTSFFERPFIHLVVVDKAFRRQGIAKMLIAEVERRFTNTTIFTSTNKSNQPAQGLFQALGYVQSGMVNNLDDGDPEVFFCKQRGGENA